MDSYIGGNEHAVLHLLYARFVTMALHDMGHIDFEEPFTRFRAHGLIVKDGRQDVEDQGQRRRPRRRTSPSGAPTPSALYLMFLGPYQEGGDFRDGGITGPYNFLTRLWDSVLSSEGPAPGGAGRAEAARHHQEGDATTWRCSATTRPSRRMMEYLNVVRAGGRTPERAAVEPLVRLVAPFAPHVAEELWERLGHTESIFVEARWPEYDPAKTVADTVEFVVQVNGKVRARMPMARGIGEAQARDAALADENVQRWIEGKQVRKTIFVADRLVNLVIG